MKSLSKKLRAAERGQAILLIALAMVGLVAFVGLMVDIGVLFMEQGKLKRGIDSAAIAAAQQFRKGFVVDDLVAAANNFLILNDTAADNVLIYRCKDGSTVVDGTIEDPTLCTTPRRKLIRVEAQRWVPFSFLRVVGLQGRMINASSVSEAASIDIVLVIDTSTSMSYDTYTGPCASPELETHCATDGTLVDEENPAVCNVSVSKPCEPLHTVKNVALEFVDTLFLPYDRVGIVTMTSQDVDGLRPPETQLELSGDLSAVQAAINALRVFQPPVCPTTSGPCIDYGEVDHDDNPGTAGQIGFAGMNCPVAYTTLDPSSCNSSNIGGALLLAGNRFVEPGYQRDESLWIIILLAGGPANATDPVDGLPDGFCPRNTWVDQTTNPLCRGADVSEATRHDYDPDSPDPDFDADDYARFRADELADPDASGIVIFTIGLGELVIDASRGDADAGEQLLDYVATEAGDTAVRQANHGTYSFAPDADALDEIFADIAANIFTRITQ